MQQPPSGVTVLTHYYLGLGSDQTSDLSEERVFVLAALSFLYFMRGKCVLGSSARNG